VHCFVRQGFEQSEIEAGRDSAYFLHSPARATELSFTARIQRGPSQPARCASTEDHQAPSLPLFCEQEGQSVALASSFVRFHVGSKEGIDPRLITRPLGLEPI
jgi:hypothetical protein